MLFLCALLLLLASPAIGFAFSASRSKAQCSRSAKAPSPLHAQAKRTAAKGEEPGPAPRKRNPSNRDKGIAAMIEQTDFQRTQTKSLTPLDEDPMMPMVNSIVVAADNRKAAYISALRISHLTEITTMMVIVEGNSRPQNQAIALSIEEDVLLQFSQQPSKQGNAASGWIVLDYGSVIVHIMTPQMRSFYKLERRWRDSETVDVSRIISTNFKDRSVEEEDEDAAAAAGEAEDDVFWQ